mgnify:CR=1 FL=1
MAKLKCKYKIGDIVNVYSISYNYRVKNKNVKFIKYKCIIEKISNSTTKYKYEYGIRNIKTKETGSWFTPDFLELA